MKEAVGKANRMKILLVDFFMDGHHIEYATHLGRFLLEKGHEVVFLTWSPDERLQVALDIGLDVRYLANRDCSLPSQTFRMIPRFRGMLRNCFKVAAEEHADLVHLLYLDRAFSGSAINPSPCLRTRSPISPTSVAMTGFRAPAARCTTPDVPRKDLR